jgi:hypothetical protein
MATVEELQTEIAALRARIRRLEENQTVVVRLVIPGAALAQQTLIQKRDAAGAAGQDSTKFAALADHIQQDFELLQELNLLTTPDAAGSNG